MEGIAHVFQLAEEREKSQCPLHVQAAPANRCAHSELNVVMTGPGNNANQRFLLGMEEKYGKGKRRCG